MPHKTLEPKDRLILSIHIQKTAGTRFGEILRRRHGEGFALYYGANDERTHPMLRVDPQDVTAERLNALAESGITCLHGHIRARALLKAVPNPKQYYVFLREPIEQTLSRYHFVRSLPEGGKMHARMREHDYSIDEFVQLPAISNFQSNYLEPLDPRQVGFLGVTELFESMIALLGLSDTSHRANVNTKKPVVDIETRAAMAPHLTADLALYSLAMELAIRRLGVRDTKRRARYRNNIAHLARRFGAPV
ncbi:sulfotransferase family 2 domain-containing protein [Acuticoccus sp. MNP-M23]|uniref:sulfotransferase family 2 domain-containing protein n=1 Tax=Acuticoccus sp. MNP-M23 TaxID=3072793 RepID=UPI0028162902|nr:sulfotransferase family 2 domain-containing protein [Acuticoccus sp. MNP-M23]WMS42853.1 sulfotransferase family 2 domain-containing protein [Acuticoccus sp. MNP-M23]